MSYKTCRNCRNLMETPYLINNTQVILCSLTKIETGLEDSCVRFIEIKKRPVPPILKPDATGFRGFSETFSGFIKTKEGQVISV